MCLRDFSVNLNIMRNTVPIMNHKLGNSEQVLGATLGSLGTRAMFKVDNSKNSVLFHTGDDLVIVVNLHYSL